MYIIFILKMYTLLQLLHLQLLLFITFDIDTN